MVSGFKVFPNEIEDVVIMHPGVLEAAAIGVTDPKSGEAVKLFVVRKHPKLTEQALLEHCRKNLTGYKVPKLIEFRDKPLPKSNIGKILRRQLREPMTQCVAPPLMAEHSKNDHRVAASSAARRASTTPTTSIRRSITKSSSSMNRSQT